ncbi:hypothetical protein JYU34_005369 [Plutella xylostella]|uniref:Retrovirus-related Pol polyprotein from transposon TNT 1-94-like beta-barrel domain-containing protein n=1 Tax=Plutella xylostella TaxID=51655 RepID=A0ABQ7QWJ0_PLUXY|nr:hypothetical protein JYU34_005369 [Plutella xylostella]
MCGNKSAMYDLISEKSIKIHLADGNMLHTAGRGSVKVLLKDNNVKTISNVYYVPNLTVNLLSVSAMVQKGFEVVFSSGMCKISDNGVVVATGTLCNGAYQLDTKPNPWKCNFVDKGTSSVTGLEEECAQPASTELSVSHNQSTAASSVPEESMTVMAAVKGGPETAAGMQGVWHRRLAHLNHRSMDLLKKVSEVPEGAWDSTSDYGALLAPTERSC